MKTIELDGLSPAQRQTWLQHAVAPRPIGLVSTVDSQGRPNLSPFSFFNLFSSNPPIVIFSPARRVRDNTAKHTLENVIEVPEAVVHIVDMSIVQQASLASCEYPAGVNEFEMAGFTAIPSQHVRPPRVKESPIHLECVVNEVKPLGLDGGAGNLVICEVRCMHVAEGILNEDWTMIDQRRLHHTARLGGDWYCRVDESNLFQVEKPNQKLGIGFPNLPEDIRNSRILTGNQLAQLANVDVLPDAEPGFHDPHVKQIVQYFSPNPEEMEAELHRHAAFLLDRGRVRDAWQVLLMSSSH